MQMQTVLTRQIGNCKSGPYPFPFVITVVKEHLEFLGEKKTGEIMGFKGHLTRSLADVFYFPLPYIHSL